jgi:hypothetical protein
MNERPVTDAVVNFENARPWVEALFREDPDVVSRRVLKMEPAIMSAVAVAGKQTIEQLERNGASEQMLSFVLSQMLFAGAIGVELMKKGNGLLFSDLIEPASEKSKGATNE